MDQPFVGKHLNPHVRMSDNQTPWKGPAATGRYQWSVGAGEHPMVSGVELP